MKIELEKIVNSLKGVASVLSTMSEIPEGSMIWNEWALHLLYKELNEDINKLEAVINAESNRTNENMEERE